MMTDNSTVQVTFEEDKIVLYQHDAGGKMAGRWVELPIAEAPAVAQQIYFQGTEYARVKVAGWRVVARLFIAQVKAAFGIKP